MKGYHLVMLLKKFLNIFYELFRFDGCMQGFIKINSLLTLLFDSFLAGSAFMHIL